MTKQELFDKADYYKGMIDMIRPLNSDQQKELDQYFRVGLTYSNNGIEGNTLTMAEIKILLEDGITVSGKPIKDYYETSGHVQAYDYMLSVARSKQFDITEDIMRKINFLLCYRIDPEEAGQYRKGQASISGLGYQPPKAEEVPHFMEHFINQMQSSKRFMHPIEFAAICHKRLLDIRPFKEGNGQAARLLMNLILENAGYGITSIPPMLRKEYNNALILAQNNGNPNIDPLIEFIAECVIEAERDYCRLLKIK